MPPDASSVKFCCQRRSRVLRYVSLPSDFSIDCTSGKFIMSLLLAGVGILLIPIGVPFMFLFFMKRSKDALGGVNQTAVGGAKLVAEEVNDEDDPYGYLCKDCKPEYWCSCCHSIFAALNIRPVALGRLRVPTVL